MDKKPETSGDSEPGKEARKKPSDSPAKITPGSAEGDLETVEEDLKLQERRKKKQA